MAFVYVDNIDMLILCWIDGWMVGFYVGFIDGLVIIKGKQVKKGSVDAHGRRLDLKSH